MVNIKVKFDKSQLKVAVENSIGLINHNVAKVIRDEAIPDLIEKIMVGFDDLAARAEMLPEDPTNPGNWRAEFRDKLYEDFHETFIVNDNVIEVKIGEKSFLGYDAGGQTNEPRDGTPLQWMVYYIEGLAGEWGFITPEIYESLRGEGRFNEQWGRFGKGFMISRDKFEEQHWDRVVNFDQIRHPFSGYAPLDIFTEALREFRLKPFVDKALRAAAAGRKL